jgi:hypothetical protein
MKLLAGRAGFRVGVIGRVGLGVGYAEGMLRLRLRLEGEASVVILNNAGFINQTQQRREGRTKSTSPLCLVDKQR